MAAAPASQVFAASKPALREKSFNAYFSRASKAERWAFIKDLKINVGAALRKRFLMTPEQVVEFAALKSKDQAKLSRFGDYALKNDLSLRVGVNFVPDHGNVSTVTAKDRSISFTLETEL